MFTLGLWQGEIEACRRERLFMCVWQRGFCICGVWHTALSLQQPGRSRRDASQWTTSPVCFLRRTAEWLTAGLLCVLYCVFVWHFSVSVHVELTDEQKQSNVHEEGEDGCHFHREQPPSPVTLSFSFTVYLSGLCSLLLPSLLSTHTHAHTHIRTKNTCFLTH